MQPRLQELFRGTMWGRIVQRGEGRRERERESESNPLLQPWRKKENERDWDLGSHV